MDVLPRLHFAFTFRCYNPNLCAFYLVIATHSSDIAFEADMLLEMVDGKITTVNACT